MVWLQTGFAMVVLSAAIKGVPERDHRGGPHATAPASRRSSSGSSCRRSGAPIIAVATTIAIAILKVFDIVYVTTGGHFETEVVANRMFDEMFRLPELRATPAPSR